MAESTQCTQSKASDEKTKMLKKMFDELDKDGSGKITANELAVSMKEAGKKPNKNEIDDLIDAADADGDRMIDFNEFVEMMSSDNEGDSDDTLKELFDAYDADGSGCVSLKEVESMLEKQGLKMDEKTVNEFLALDVNGDGRVTFEEFKKMVTS